MPQNRARASVLQRWLLLAQRLGLLGREVSLCGYRWHPNPRRLIDHRGALLGRTRDHVGRGWRLFHIGVRVLRLFDIGVRVLRLFDIGVRVLRLFDMCACVLTSVWRAPLLTSMWRPGPDQHRCARPAADQHGVRSQLLGFQLLDLLRLLRFLSWSASGDGRRWFDGGRFNRLCVINRCCRRGIREDSCSRQDRMRTNCDLPAC